MVALNISGLLPDSDGVAVTWKSHPVPVSGIVCGLPPALSVTVSVPVRAPTTVGANVTPIEQVPAAARVAGLIGQVFVSAKSPDAAIELIVKGPIPVLVSFAWIAALVVVAAFLATTRLQPSSPGRIAGDSAGQSCSADFCARRPRPGNAATDQRAHSKSLYGSKVWSARLRDWKWRPTRYIGVRCARTVARTAGQPIGHHRYSPCPGKLSRL
jgi:hypothetical protein